MWNAFQKGGVVRSKEKNLLKWIKNERNGQEYRLASEV